MGAVLFYHLTRRPLEATLPLLLEKSLGAGWRVEVRGRARDRMDWLDQKLWQGADDGFLPHGLAGGPHDARQPILLTWQMPALNDPQCLMAIDGAEISADEVQAMERACVLFEGHDPQAVQIARGQWKTLTAAGCKAQYWSEDSGRWEKQAEA
ncbi:DNA polymerase III subunit chi [Tropicibacter oceani]|uniref:DNA polymerase III subunit chi n=1 Tax=Tropicibacter oceani TaxID=3058420 RepID=A0ABY8QER8_9RHOB|nr:DNA polymerase III subunit chi [Tropicibacter oceani]WGW02493.1 DNA polymerase III subunit chi [Tropicibacter oceani]